MLVPTTCACGAAAARSLAMARRARSWVHAAVGAALAFGAVSIALSALRIVGLPWWLAAFAVAGVAPIHALIRRRSRA